MVFAPYETDISMYYTGDLGYGIGYIAGQTGRGQAPPLLNSIRAPLQS
jgi:hypothetical protein